MPNSERLRDLFSVLRVLFGEGPEEAEAAGDHHVAVRHGEVWVEPAASQFSALGARNGDYRPLRFLISVVARSPIGVVGAMTLRAKDYFWRKRSANPTLGVVFDMGW